MLTICTTPKPFRGHIGVIQRNALESWTRLEPRPEILVFGDDEGAAEVCRELGLRQVPEIARTDYGTPYLDDILRQGQARAGTDLVAYVNADILLLDDFLPALERTAASCQQFLAVGQRWELDVPAPLDFSDPEWQNGVRRRVATEAWQAGMTAIDYFVFRRGFYRELPMFVAGRGGFDWWLIHDARRRAPVIDVTPLVAAVHQRHEGVWSKNGYDAELQHNFGLYTVPWTNLYDATHLLTPRGLRPIWWRRPLKPFWLVQERYGVPIVRFSRAVRRRLAPPRPAGSAALTSEPAA